MSTTRLLVLGAVRIFQPAHGYFLRRELLSWDVEKWANINPGSIYNALRTLTREGYLTETAAEDATKTKARYELTHDGGTEFLQLVRSALWQVDQWDGSTLLGGLCFMHFLPREELLDAMSARADALRGILSSTGHALRDMEKNRSAPAQTAEQFLLSSARWDGELRWCVDILERIRQGYYRFNGEPGWDAGPFSDGSWPGPLDKHAHIQA